MPDLPTTFDAALDTIEAMATSQVLPLVPTLSAVALAACEDLCAVASYAYRVHDLCWTYSVAEDAGETWQYVIFYSPTADITYLSLGTNGPDRWAAYDIDHERLPFPRTDFVDLASRIAVVLWAELKEALAAVLVHFETPLTGGWPVVALRACAGLLGQGKPLMIPGQPWVGPRTPLDSLQPCL